jgi:hypothetical protein
MNQDPVFTQELQGWLAGRLPDDWFTGPPEVISDRDEVLIVGSLPEPSVPEGASADTAREARIAAWREETRGRRMRIAIEAQRRFRRKVSWGAECGGVRRLFTVLAMPAMTRLRLPERAVLDTLVDAGVARSRSEALAWCVRLVQKNEDEWLRELREAFAQVEQVRAGGPQVF